VGIIFLSPLFIVIAMLILVDSKGGVFYFQDRVGKGNIDFRLFKFRTMTAGADKKGLLTVGSTDARITKVGYSLRKYKLDELPQLFNVINGTMSFVGPRPEVRKYVDLYSQDQREVLEVKPGITDYASLEYFNENDLLAKSDNPEQTYVEEVMPAKIALNKKYIAKPDLATDVKIIFKTIGKIFS
jgi:lipopolysaccharide/colanic/teichoic acid biosynthesis glycosyltransferase